MSDDVFIEDEPQDFTAPEPVEDVADETLAPEPVSEDPIPLPPDLGDRHEVAPGVHARASSLVERAARTNDDQPEVYSADVAK